MSPKVERSRQRRLDTPVVVAALAAAALSVAGHVLGKSVRDTLYLATFPVEWLPYFFLGTGLVSGVAVSAYTRLGAAFSPKRVIPVLSVISALSYPLLWIGARGGSPWVIALLYVWTSISGGFLVSGFWAVFGERFHVGTAKQIFGLVGGATTVGGLVGGLGAHALLQAMDAETLLLPLAGVDMLLALALLRLGRENAPTKAEPERAPDTQRPGGLRQGLADIAGSSYLRDVTLLMGAVTIAGTFTEYMFKDAASRVLTSKHELAEFFSLFHGAVGALTLGVQVLACRPLVAKKGIAAALMALPLTLGIGALGVMLVYPTATVVSMLWASTGLRAGDNAVRNSFYRAGYELLFVPLPPAEKRVAKPIVDSLLERVADALGAGLVLLLVIVLHLPAERLAWGILVLGGAGLYLTLRVRRSYVATLSASLVARAVELDEVVRAADDDATAREAIRVTLLDQKQDELRKTMRKSQLGLSLMRSVQLELPKQLEMLRRGSKTDTLDPGGGGKIARSTHPATGALLPMEDPVVQVIRQLSDPDAAVVRGAIARWDGKDKRFVAFLVRLLARDELQQQVTSILARAGDRVAGSLADHLADEQEAFAVRRRIPRILSACQSFVAIDALTRGISDRRFEVRYHCAEALERIQGREGRRPTAEAVWAAVREEVKKSRSMWEAQRLLDEPEGREDPRAAGTTVPPQALSERASQSSELVSRRGAHSLRHVFRLLGLVLDPKALELSYKSVHTNDEAFRAVGLEYLENVLPPDVRTSLWPLIGDDEPPPMSRTGRSLSEVMKELSSSGMTLDRLALTGAGGMTIRAEDGKATARSRIAGAGADKGGEGPAAEAGDPSDKKR